MKGCLGEILYIGKANNLHDRVMQYFNGTDKREKIPELIKKVFDIDYIVVSSETEALILENNLIVKNTPPFNAKLRWNFSYSYVKVTKEEYPRVLAVREIINDKSFYFGPFDDFGKVFFVTSFLQKEYGIRKCSKIPKKECIYRQINECLSPCVCDTYLKYKENIREILDILRGKNTDIINKYTEKMNKYLNNMDFENAKYCRDVIKNLMYISQKQSISTNKDENFDVCAESIGGEYSCIILMHVKKGSIIGSEKFLTKTIFSESMLCDFLSMYYGSTRNVSEVVAEVSDEHSKLLSEYFNDAFGKDLKFSKPSGGKKKDMYLLAKKNCDIHIKEKIRKIDLKPGLDELFDITGIKCSCAEAIDVSHIGGKNVYAGIIRIEGGVLCKDKYRTLKLPDTNNDVLSIKKAIIKRFSSDSFSNVPDVIFIDGGSAQVDAAKKALLECKISGCQIIGMVKDEKHRSDSILYEGKKYSLIEHRKLYVAIGIIQEEAHRYCLFASRKKAGKNITASALDNIPGVGEKTKNLLLIKFGSIKNIKNASVEELCTINGIGPVTANNILKNLNC